MKIIKLILHIGFATFIIGFLMFTWNSPTIYFSGKLVFTGALTMAVGAYTAIWKK